MALIDYYLSPVVGTGSEQDPYRLKISDYYGHTVAVVDPTLGWGVGMVRDELHAASASDPDVYRFPAGLSTLIGELPADHQSQLVAFLTGYGLPSSSTLGEALRMFALLSDDRFEVSNFGVGKE